MNDIEESKRLEDGQLNNEEEEKDKDKEVVVLSQIKRKGIAVIASLLLLIAVLIVGSIAWYTRIAGVTGMTLEAAKFDFKANYVESDLFINAADYLDVEHNKAAPGAGGVIPIMLNADQSETAVKYTINLDFSETAEEFKERLRFYYYDKNNNVHIIDPSSSMSPDNAITGYVMQNHNTYEYIYWKWRYELDDDWFYVDGKWYENSTSKNYNVKNSEGNVVQMTGKAYFESLYQNTLATESDAFDAFDTIIGLGQGDDEIAVHMGQSNGEPVLTTLTSVNSPTDMTAYQRAMKVKLVVSGAQAMPVTDTNAFGIGNGNYASATTIYKGAGQ